MRKDLLAGALQLTESQVWPSAPTQRRILLGLLLVVLGLACLLVLKQFFTPIAWAGILAYATWPLYRRLHALLRTLNVTAALLMTLLVTCAVILPVLWLVVLVRDELLQAYKQAAGYLAQGPHALPSMIRDVPWLGAKLQIKLDTYTTDPAALARELSLWLQNSGSQVTAMLGGVGRTAAKLFLTMITLFFFYRDGDSILVQSRRIVRRFFGDRLDRYVDAAGTMTRAVLYGLMVSAFAQGVIAGIGYRIVGLEAPVLLAALTGVLSVVPLVGTAAVWAPIALWLLATGPLWKGLVLLLWGFLLVHPTDNVLRPLLISNAMHVPFLLVMFGAIGGLSSFGLVGVFVGPMVLGVAIMIWREWAKQE